jgi:farnesyl diphosphate synthase
MGLRQSQNYAQELLSQAQASLRHSGLSDTRALQALADKLVNRAF